ncbi:MAG: aminodeoxychorismate/anthranilate synthase component II [Marinilabiliales bacterium]|nr:MAG: aminodeoxychorismate/anthranilate synthase component II [Marinilabiliales bacterium]
MARILIVDNYDSFTYNLVHYVNEYPGHTTEVLRNDKIDLASVEQYDGILLSPGPGIPSESGDLLRIIDMYKEKKRIFGVCLGLQAIAEVFGGSLLNTDKVYHGVATTITLLEPVHYLFRGLPGRFQGGRYHSWVVRRDKVPQTLRIDAVDDEQYIMAMSHRELDVCGVQFHPESILTPDGKKIVFNWLRGFES